MERFKGKSLRFANTSEGLLTLAQMAYRIYHKKDVNYEKIVQALSDVMDQMFVAWVMRNTNDDDWKNNRLISAFIYDLIQNISNSSFDIAKAIAANGYCTDHFRRLFKKETGTTPTKYLIRLRIDTARKLLEQEYIFGTMIKEIARLSGFADPLYFSKLFKDKVGLSPSDYTGVAGTKVYRKEPDNINGEIISIASNPK